MANTNFTRSNVTELSMQLSQPLRSSFDLSHNDNVCLRMGRFTPVSIEHIMPSDTFNGAVKPKLMLEKIGGQMMGKLRLDSHTFFVSRQRINRDFRLHYSGLAHSNVLQVPRFNLTATLARLLHSILAPTGRLEPDVSKEASIKVIMAEWDDQNLLNIFQSAYFHLMSDNDNRYGFTQDFFALEHERLNSLQSVQMSYSEQLLTILEPYCGLGSIFDYAGYPIWHKLLPYYKNIPDTWFTSEEHNFYDFLRIESASHGLVTFGEDVYKNIEPLYAFYTCWFDHMRDFHLEPNNGSILNPDEFDSKDPFAVSANSPASRDSARFLSSAVQLLVPKFRYFGRDMFTTVQPDDVYRHVYVPILNRADSNVGTVSTDAAGAIDKAVSILIQDSVISDQGSGVHVPFLSDLFHHSDSTKSAEIFRQDLQTMRRTGWCETWLMRNWAHPDTFAGQINARFGVDPLNASVLEAQYLGGDEQFVSGEEQKANVGTESTPAGQRTIVGGVSLSDSFSYNTTEFGYVCSFLSLVPLPKYDAANMHLDDATYIDLPAPEFAQDARVQISAGDMIRGLSKDVIMGYVPRYYHYRLRLDATHDRFISDLRTYDFIRDSLNMSSITDSIFGRLPEFTLNPYTARVHNMNDCFLAAKEYDPVMFGEVEFDMFMNRALPAAIEFA